MKHIGSSNYIIYFDSYRVDHLVLDFTSNLGLSLLEAEASISMLNADSLENWKAYLTEVRIFIKDIYTGKFRQVFEGDITARNGSSSRQSTGRTVYTVKGLYTWLELPVPMFIRNLDNLDVLRSFQLQAQNIDVDALVQFIQTKKELFGTDKTIEQIIRRLFELLNQGYSKITDNDTAFGFKDLLTKFKVMSDIDPKFRDKGFLDLTTFTQATTLQGFYDFLNEILAQMMMEFFQDIDGSIKVKGPSWNDKIPLGHILDESVVDDVSRGIAWDAQPTRILAIGGKSEILEAMTGEDRNNPGINMQIPVGLYINGGKYIGMHFDAFLRDGAGNGGDESLEGEEGYVNGWFDDISNKKMYALGTYLNKEYERLRINGGKPHLGVDYYMSFETLNNQGTDGVVEEVRVITGGGNSITIKQQINETTYYFTYMHLDSLPNFKKGDKVKAGQKLGKTGDTGIGPPHLHFQIWKNGFDWGNQRALTIDPVPFMKAMKKQAAASGGGVPGNLYGAKDYKGPDTTSNGYVKGVKARWALVAKHDALIERICKEQGVNPMLIKILVLIESNGNANAKGVPTKYGTAVGLLQIIPGAVGIKVDASRLTDPAYNIEMGCKAMKTEKKKLLEGIGRKLTVHNIANSWYGFDSNGAKYAAACSEIYEGFAGNSRNDPYMGKFETKKSKADAKKNAEVKPRVSGPQDHSFSMARTLIQGERHADIVASAVVIPEPGGSKPADPPVYSGNPYSPGGSFQEGTPDASIDKNVLSSGDAVAVPAKDHKQKFTLPSGRGDLARILENNRNGVDINLVWAMAKEFSNLNARAKFKDDQTESPEWHFGLMGVPKSYMAENNLSEEEMYDPAKNIYHGTKLYKECLATTKKHSFAMLVYFLGGGGLTVLQGIRKKAEGEGISYSFVDMLHLIEGIYDTSRKGYFLFDYSQSKFTDSRAPIRRAVMNWTQGAVDNYAAVMGGNYIKGDPHRGFKNLPTYHAKPGNVTIALDAAFGGSENGDVSNGLTEKTLTLDFAKKVKGKLEAFKPSTGGDNPMKVTMTRSNDSKISNKDRAKKIKSASATQVYGFIFSKGGKGVTVYVRDGATVGSKTLQEKVGKRVAPVVEKYGLRYNGLKNASAGLLPALGSESAIVIDLGHLDDEKDATSIKNSDYLEDMATAIVGGIVNAANADGNQVSNPTAPATATEFPDFFSKYKPQLSAEEKKYKMQFTMIEMELIRAGGETGGDIGAAEAYLEQFAKYMMHVLRARATGITVPCNHAMPHIRPGFNAWLEPTREDKVFYVTGVQHSGSFAAGCTTTIRGAYTRNPDEYDEKFNENLFVSKTNYRVEDLVPVVDKKEMANIRKDLKKIHAEQVVERNGHPYLKKLYTVKENPNKSIIQGNWNALMTPGEIEKEIKSHFSDAPKVVIARIKDGKTALDKARDLHKEYMPRSDTF